MLIENIGTTKPAANQPMTESEAASRLGLKVATLRAWRHQGRGPAYVRLGRAVRYLAIDIDEFLTTRIATTRARPPRTSGPRLCLSEVNHEQDDSATDNR